MNDQPDPPLRTCARCGGTNFEPGLLKIQHSGDVVLRLLKTPPLALAHHVPVIVEMCLDCGALEFTADVAKASQVLR